MLNEVQEWKRSDAEKQFTDLLEGAKEGRIQRIADIDGTFEVTFTAKSAKEHISDVLARGGPADV